MLWALALGSIGGAVAIGIGAALAWTLWLLPFVAVGAFLVFAYNLELFGGLFHTDLGSRSPGAPTADRLLRRRRGADGEALLAAAFAVATSLAQRALSTPFGRCGGGARTLRARSSGRNGALRALTVAMVALAALLALRW